MFACGREGLGTRLQYGSVKGKQVLHPCSLLHGHTIASLEEEGFDILPAYLFFLFSRNPRVHFIQICGHKYVHTNHTCIVLLRYILVSAVLYVLHVQL